MQIIIKLTTGCNLACVYCSEGDKEPMILDKTILHKMIEEIPELLNQLNDKNITFLWHGGEPLLVGKQYLIESMDFAISKLKCFNPRFLVQSNGTLIDDEWVDIFKKYNVHVGVSLDGYRELHDINRLKKDGTPTFNIIMKNIRLLQEAGCFGGAIMVLNRPEIVDVNQLYSFIKSENLTLKIRPVIPCGRASNLNTESIDDQFVILMKNLYEKIMSDDDMILLDPLDEIMDAILGVGCIRECAYNGSCSRNFICLFTDGTMSFCGRSGIGADFIFGKVKDSSLKSLYNSKAAVQIRSRKDYLVNHDCKECKYWSLCYGGCGYEALTATGNLFSKYPGCEARKKLLDYLMTTGIVLLKNKLIRQKQKYRLLNAEREKMLKELEDEDQ